MTSDEQPLEPGWHPPPQGRYSFDYNGNQVHADSGSVGNPFAGGLRTAADPLVAAVLGPALANPSISEETKAVIPWALTTVAATTPDALGMYGPARYSGPGPTSLVGNVAHRTRGEAFAAELVVAACLTEAAWTSTSGPLSLELASGARMDFGIKHRGGSSRRTVESDILLSDRAGHRRGVDVKFSRHGVYRHPVATGVLDGLRRALDDGELASFHWVTPGRFTPRVKRSLEAVPGVHLHEAVWPSPADRARIETVERQAIATSTIVREWTQASKPDLLDLGKRLRDAAWEAYERTWGSGRALVEIDLPDGFTYLFDSLDSPAPQPPARLVAAYGLAQKRSVSRQPAFMKGFPLPPLDMKLDRGHIIALSSGGAEDVGVNLVPQNRRLNRGRGLQGRRWRMIERMSARNPGSLVWRRAVYGCADDIPTNLETLVAVDPTTVVMDVFTNRSCIERKAEER